MRPGGLGEVLDDGGDAAVALGEQDVAGLQDVGERLGIAGGERLVARRGLLEIVDDAPTKEAEEPVAHVPRAATGPPLRNATCYDGSGRRFPQGSRGSAFASVYALKH